MKHFILALTLLAAPLQAAELERAPGKGAPWIATSVALPAYGAMPGPGLEVLRLAPWGDVVVSKQWAGSRLLVFVEAAAGGRALDPVSVVGCLAPGKQDEFELTGAGLVLTAYVDTGDELDPKLGLFDLVTGLPVSHAGCGGACVLAGSNLCQQATPSFRFECPFVALEAAGDLRVAVAASPSSAGCYVLTIRTESGGAPALFQTADDVPSTF